MTHRENLEVVRAAGVSPREFAQRLAGELRIQAKGHSTVHELADSLADGELDRELAAILGYC